MDNTKSTRPSLDLRSPSADSKTHSVPPLYSKTTANVCAAFPCYPCCCLPCCCKNKDNTCRPYGCPEWYKEQQTKTDRQDRCLGGFGCMGCHVFDFVFETNRSKVLSLWNLVVCFAVLISTLNPLGSAYESAAGCHPAFSYRPGLLKAVYWPNTVNFTDLATSPQKYCRPHELLVALTGTEQQLRSKLLGPSNKFTMKKHVPYLSQNGPIGTCAALTFSSNAIGTFGQIGFGGLNSLILRPILIAAANTRQNRFYGWGGLAFIGSIANTFWLMNNRGNDLGYCPLMQQEVLYGDLNRIHGVTESSYIDGGNGAFRYKKPPRPVPVSSELVQNLTQTLRKEMMHGKWNITETELNSTLAELCEGSSVESKCAITFTAAVTQMKQAGFVYDSVSTTYVGTSRILTFNTFDKSIRSGDVSTLAILSKFFWPFPQFNISTFYFPPQSSTLKNEPMSLDSLIDTTFHNQLTYSRARGGFWMLINWANYISLYIEFGLLLWITMKAFVRANPKAQFLFRKNVSTYAHKSFKRQLSQSFTGGGKEKDKKIKFNGLPTRLKASVILSVFITMAFGK